MGSANVSRLTDGKKCQKSPTVKMLTAPTELKIFILVKKTQLDGSTVICIPPRLHLSSENIDRHGVYILDACECIYMWIGRSVNDQFLQQVFNVKSFNELPDHLVCVRMLFFRVLVLNV
jgi:hypothetical protein